DTAAAGQLTIATADEKCDLLTQKLFDRERVTALSRVRQIEQIGVEFGQQLSSIDGVRSFGRDFNRVHRTIISSATHLFTAILRKAGTRAVEWRLTKTWGQEAKPRQLCL